LVQSWFPEHQKFAKEGVVHWTDVDNPLLKVKVINWNKNGKQCLYVDPSAYNNRIPTEVPLITVIFLDDGSVKWLAPSGVVVETKNNVNTLRIQGQSLINLLVTDPNGRSVGYDPSTNSVKSEIAEAAYTGPGVTPQLITIQNPIEGDYKITVYGKGQGAFGVTVERLDYAGSISNSLSFHGSASPGETQRFSIGVSAAGKLSVRALDETQKWLTLVGLIAAVVLISAIVIRMRRTKLRIWTFPRCPESLSCSSLQTMFYTLR